MRMQRKKELPQGWGEEQEDRRGIFALECPELRANLLRPGGGKTLEPSDTYSRVSGASEQDGMLGEVLGGMQLIKRKTTQ